MLNFLDRFITVSSLLLCTIALAVLVSQPDHNNAIRSELSLLNQQTQQFLATVESSQQNQNARLSRLEIAACRNFPNPHPVQCK